MAQVNFPVATANGQVFTADTGVTYIYVGTPPNGYWSGNTSVENLATLDGRYLQLDGSNGPLTDNVVFSANQTKGNLTDSGIVKLLDTTNSTSDTSNGIAATPKAVKDAYDRASTGITDAGNAATAASAAQSDATQALSDAAAAQTTATSGVNKANDAQADATQALADAAAAQDTANGAVSAVNSINTGDATTKGIVTLSNSTTSNSGENDGTAATPQAVKNTMVKAEAALPKSGGSMTGYITFASSQNFDGSKVSQARADAFGCVGLSDSVTSTLDTTNGIAATPKAVKIAYDQGASALTASQTAVSDASAAYTLADSAKTIATAAQTTAIAALSKSGGTITGSLTVSNWIRINGSASGTAPAIRFADDNTGTYLSLIHI